MPQLYNAPIEVAGPTGGRRADASDIGGGAGLIQAGAALSERSDVMVAAQERVVARRDIIHGARQESNRGAWERENVSAALNSDLTNADKMQEASNASLAFNATALDAANLSSQGRQDLSLKLMAQHTTYLNGLSMAASKQQFKLLAGVVQDGTNGFAASASSTPHAWRELVASGNADVLKTKGAVPPTQAKAWQQGRTVVIMKAALAKFVEVGSIFDAVALVGSPLFKRNFSPQQQRDAYVSIKVKTTETNKGKKLVEVFSSAWEAANGEVPPKHVLQAFVLAKFNINPAKRTPQAIMADVISRFPDMLPGDRLRLYVALVSEGKVNDLGSGAEDDDDSGYAKYLSTLNIEDSIEAQLGYSRLSVETQQRYSGVPLAPAGAAVKKKETGYQVFLRVMSTEDSLKARSDFDSLTFDDKQLLLGIRPGAEKKVIPETKMDRVQASFQSLFRVKAFTSEQEANIAPLLEFDFAKATVGSLISAYQQVYGSDPTQGLMAEWGSRYPFGDEITLKGPGVYMTSLGIANDLMTRYDEPAFTTITPEDRRTFEGALYSMALGRNIGSDDLGNAIIEKPELPRSVIAFAERMGVQLPPSYLIGRSIMEGEKANWQTSVSAQKKGLWARTPSFKGIVAAWEDFKSGLPFTGEITPAQRMVVAFGTIAKSLRQSLINAKRAPGMRMLASERLDIVTILDGVLKPGGWADPTRAQAAMTGLEMSLAKQQEFLEKIVADKGGSSLRQRQNAQALANEIAEVRMLMNVPPVIETDEDLAELPVGLRYQFIDDKGFHVRTKK